MSSFPIYATSPLPWAILLLVLLLLAWHLLPGGVRWAGVVIEVLLIVLMTPIGSEALARSLAARIPPVSACVAPQPTTVVVLAGGFDYSPRSPDDFGALRSVSLQRLFAGVALWRRIPDAHLVVAGGGGALVREADLMANLAVQLGVPAASIELDDRSHNTWENARNVAALSPAVPRRIWLVTSPMHLPRALQAFRAWGFEPCAWPTDRRYRNVHIWPGAFIPQGSAARTASVALHELIGGWKYAWMARQHARNDTSSTRPLP